MHIPLSGAVTTLRIIPGSGSGREMHKAVGSGRDPGPTAGSYLFAYFKMSQPCEMVEPWP